MDKILYVIAKFLFSFLFNVRVEGVEKMEEIKGPVILASNHQSYLDGPLAFAFAPKHLSPVRFPVARIYFLPSQSKFPFPLNLMAAWILKAAKCIPVDNGRVMGVRQALNLLKSGESLWVFPEGKINREFGRLRDGVFLLQRYTGFPIVPVGIRGTRGFLRKIFTREEIVVSFGAPAENMEKRELEREIKNLLEKDEISETEPVVA